MVLWLLPKIEPTRCQFRVSLYFQYFPNFVKTLKIRVKLILNCPRVHAITYTKLPSRDIVSRKQFNNWTEAPQLLHSNSFANGFEHYFGPRGGNFNAPIFKSSNTRALPGRVLLKAYLRPSGPAARGPVLIFHSFLSSGNSTHMHRSGLGVQHGRRWVWIRLPLNHLNRLTMQFLSIGFCQQKTK